MINTYEAYRATVRISFDRWTERLTDRAVLAISASKPESGHANKLEPFGMARMKQRKPQLLGWGFSFLGFPW